MFPPDVSRRENLCIFIALISRGRQGGSEEKTHLPEHECLSNVPQHVFLEPCHHKLYIFLDCGHNEHNANQYLKRG